MAHAGGIQPTKRQVQRLHLADARMIGKQGVDVFMLAQHVIHKTVEHTFRTDLHKHPCPGVVQRAQALDELHRRGHLLRQHLDHLRHHLRTRRVEFAGDIGHQRNARGLQVHAL